MKSTGIFNIIGGLFLLLFSIQVLATVKAHGELPTKAMWEMARITLRGYKVVLLAGAVLGLFDSLFLPLFSSWIPPLPRMCLAGVSLVALNGACLPPTVLYLAASQIKAFSLISELQIDIAPLKMIHLLDPFPAGSVLGLQIHSTEYRVHANWQQAVRTLCKITPLIIVDIRVVTDPVIQEIADIFKSGLHDRTFFITDETGTVSVLSYLCQQLLKALREGGVKITTFQQLLKALQESRLQIATSQQLLEALRESKIQIATSQQLLKALQGIGWKFLLLGGEGPVQCVREKLKERSEL